MTADSSETSLDRHTEKDEANRLNDPFKVDIGFRRNPKAEDKLESGKRHNSDNSNEPLGFQLKPIEDWKCNICSLEIADIGTKYLPLYFKGNNQGNPDLK